MRLQIVLQSCTPGCCVQRSSHGSRSASSWSRRDRHYSFCQRSTSLVVSQVVESPVVPTESPQPYQLTGCRYLLASFSFPTTFSSETLIIVGACRCPPRPLKAVTVIYELSSALVSVHLALVREPRSICRATSPRFEGSYSLPLFTVQRCPWPPSAISSSRHSHKEGQGQLTRVNGGEKNSI